MLAGGHAGEAPFGAMAVVTHRRVTPGIAVRSAALTCYYGHTMLKVTFTLDDSTIARLERTAARLGWAKSQVVREAVLEFDSKADKLGSSEQARLLAVVDRIARRQPTCDQAKLDQELSSLRAARGGAQKP